MGRVLVTDTYLQDIADAIRTKNGEETKYKPSEMAAAILELTGSGSGETHTVLLYSYDGADLLYTVIVSDGADIPDLDAPERDSTAQYDYAHIGWSYTADSTEADGTAMLSVTENRTLYAAYSATVRTYTVYFYNDDDDLLETVYNVPYGGSATYSGSTPTKSNVDESEVDKYTFSGWSPSPTNITGDTSCYAQYDYAGLVETLSAYSWADIIEACHDGTYAEKFSVGGTKNISLGSEGNITMQISGVDVDTLADGSGTAPLSFIGEYLLPTSHNMNPALVTNYDYKEQAATTSTNNDTSVSANSTKTISFITYIQAEEVAEITNIVTATADGTLTITYTGRSATYGKLTVTVDGEDIVTDYTSTTSVAYTKEISSGDVVTIVAKYTSVSGTSGSASIKLASTGTFKLTTSCNDVMARYVVSYDNATGSIGGWEDCAMRTYLQETIAALVPEAIAEAVAEVVKTQPAYNESGTSYTQTTNDSYWIPSYDEVFGANSKYYDLFQNTAANRIKYKVDATSASSWWLRSADGTSHFYGVFTSGSYGNGSASSSYAIALGFCIGKS